MRAVCVTMRDPFRPAAHRSVDVVRRRRRIRALAPKIKQPFIALLNGRDLSGWKTMGQAPSGWKVADGLLSNDTTQEPGRHTVEPLGGPTTLKQMVKANHDYRGEW